MKWNPNLSRIVALKQAEQVIWNNNNSQACCSGPIQCFAKLLQINRPCPFRAWAAEGMGKFLGGSGWLFIFLLWEGTAIKQLFKSAMISRREVLWDVLPLPPRKSTMFSAARFPSVGLAPGLLAPGAALLGRAQLGPSRDPNHAARQGRIPLHVFNQNSSLTELFLNRSSWNFWL